MNKTLRYGTYLGKKNIVDRNEDEKNVILHSKRYDGKAYRTKFIDMQCMYETKFHRFLND